MKKQWVSWRYGWGENCEIAPGLVISASKSVHKNEKFQWEFLGYRSKPIFETLDNAKLAGMKFARKLLTEAIQMIPLDDPAS